MRCKSSSDILKALSAIYFTQTVNFGSQKRVLLFRLVVKRLNTHGFDPWILCAGSNPAGPVIRIISVTLSAVFHLFAGARSIHTLIQVNTFIERAPAISRVPGVQGVSGIVKAVLVNYIGGGKGRLQEAYRQMISSGSNPAWCVEEILQWMKQSLAQRFVLGSDTIIMQGANPYPIY